VVIEATSTQVETMMTHRFHFIHLRLT
jgi:hypothetical protein